MSRVLAVDIGAGSYRVIEGLYQDGKLTISELQRFRHAPIFEQGHYYWDISQIKSHTIDIIRKAAAQGEPVDSIGFDSFGSDFGLLDQSGNLISKPLAYRDSIGNGICGRYFKNESELYKKTGGLYDTPSTAHILKGMVRQGFPALLKAARLLFLPDLLAYLYTGRQVNEFTIATTSRLLDLGTGTWNMELAEQLGLPPQIFHPLVKSGTVIGGLRAEISEGVPGLMHTVVTASACHDTAAAAVILPQGRDTSFISSGSWSVKGIVIPRPCLTGQACAYGMSNEGQPDGSYRLIRNITGLWIMEECARCFQREGVRASIPELATQAAEAPDFPSMICTNSHHFEKPGDMTEKIRRYCRQTDQPEPASPLQFMQTLINGMVCEYRRHNEQLRAITGDDIQKLYVVGGGRKNAYLNQCTADATGCTVICGHPEATAVGNILVQLWGIGEIDSLDRFAPIASGNVEEVRYVPKAADKWKDRYKLYLDLVKNVYS